MKATQLIRELQQLIEDNGDGEVTFEQDTQSCSVSSIDVIEMGADVREFMLY